MKQTLLLLGALAATAVSAALAMRNPFWQCALALSMALSVIYGFVFLHRHPVANRSLPYLATIAAAITFAIVGAMDYAWVPLLAGFSVLAILGTLDLLQGRHSLGRKYPLIASVQTQQEIVCIACLGLPEPQVDGMLARGPKRHGHANAIHLHYTSSGQRLPFRLPQHTPPYLAGCFSDASFQRHGQE